MRLRQLTGLEQDKLRAEYEELMKTIEDLKDILDKKDRRMDIIKNELLEVKNKYGDERRSIIEYAGGDLSIEDMIPDEKVVITISHAGYIKRTPSDSIQAQKRGGKGKSGMLTKEEDFTENVFACTNHQDLLCFSNFGRVYSLKVYPSSFGFKLFSQT